MGGGNGPTDWRGIGESIHGLGMQMHNQWQQDATDAQQMLAMAQQTGDPEAIQAAASKYEAARRRISPSFSLPTRTIQPATPGQEAVTSTTRGPLTKAIGEDEVMHGPGTTPTTTEVSPAVAATPAKTEYAIPATGLDTLMSQRATIEHSISTAVTEEGRNAAYQFAKDWRARQIALHPNWAAMIPDYEDMQKQYVSRQQTAQTATNKREWQTMYRQSFSKLQAAQADRNGDLSGLLMAIQEHNQNVEAGLAAGHINERPSSPGGMDTPTMIRQWWAHQPGSVAYRMQDEAAKYGLKLSPYQQEEADLDLEKKRRVAAGPNKGDVPINDLPPGDLKDEITRIDAALADPETNIKRHAELQRRRIAVQQMIDEKTAQNRATLQSRGQAGHEGQTIPAAPGTQPTTPQSKGPVSLAAAKKKYPNVPEDQLRQELQRQGYTVTP